MEHKTFHYDWRWRLKSSPQTLWPWVADTNRFNRDASVPSLEVDRARQSELPNARRRLRFVRFGLPVEYVEQPFEWIYPHRFGVLRQYQSGPLAEVKILAELEARSEGGTDLRYQVWARPSNPLGYVAVPLQVGLLSGREFDRVFRAYDRYAVSGLSRLDMESQVRFAPGGPARLTAFKARLEGLNARPALVARLVETIARADGLTLARLRPYALADLWGEPRRELLELFLQATRVGLLEFRWDVLCPNCRGAHHSAAHLDALETRVHCPMCNIDYEANFERSVELTFRPSPAIREVDGRDFCIAGPEVTPHVRVQQLLTPGEVRRVTPMLDLGRYRLRTMSLPGAQHLRVVAEGRTSITLRAENQGWPQDELRLGSSPQLQFENATGLEQLFILERTAWSDQATTAAEVTSLQRFRDLFAREALRPGEQLSVGSVTILFADLSESTRLYQQVGDARAFGTVMGYFDLFRSAVDQAGGALVKTMGDAVMAVFQRPAAALQAGLEMQGALMGSALKIKIGLHHGPCLAITRDEQLDYFGSTVNLAWRLVGLSSGDDLIFSSSVRDDPEVGRMFVAPTGGLVAEAFESSLKGFEGLALQLWRARAKRDVGLTLGDQARSLEPPREVDGESREPSQNL